MACKLALYGTIRVRGSLLAVLRLLSGRGSRSIRAAGLRGSPGALLRAAGAGLCRKAGLLRAERGICEAEGVHGVSVVVLSKSVYGVLGKALF